MKRVNIFYGGRQYSLSDREIGELQAEINAGITADQPTWLEVNVGEGRYQPAHLLLTPGVDLVLVPIEGE
ncbi:hypothetical protein ACFJGV_16600 [Cnuibacter sp. UC19_7]|uniref:hypothetical protein n=1 Tax=Cnuibacter sp. UC19_7 TaxID=3350166 RepID=UPI00366B0FFA